MSINNLHHTMLNLDFFNRPIRSVGRTSEANSDRHGSWIKHHIHALVAISVFGFAVLLPSMNTLAGTVDWADRVEPIECSGNLEWDANRKDCVEGNAIKIEDTWYWSSAICSGSNCPTCYVKCKYGYGIVHCIKVDGTDVIQEAALDENGDKLRVAEESSAGSNSQQNSTTSASHSGKSFTVSRSSSSKQSYSGSGLGSEWDTSLQPRIADEGDNGAVI